MIKLDLNPPKDQLYQFGTVALVGFTLVGAVLTQVIGLPPVVGHIALGLAAALGLLGAQQLAGPIKPIFVGMMIVAWPIGMVISFTLLSIIYYGMFTPVSLVFRIRGRDKLNRKLDPTAGSYWITRSAQRTPASYLRLY